MKYLSKLLSMLLIGAMLWTTACTDYDEDIRDLNNKIDDIHSSLINGQIEPLKSDLARVEAQLRQALADMEANLTVMHEQDINRLQNQINDINAKIKEANDLILILDGALSKLTEDHNTLARTLVQEIARLESEYKTADEMLKTELAQQIVDAETRLKDLIRENVNNLYGEIDVLRNEMYGGIERAFEAIAAAEKEIDALDLKVDQNVADLQSSIDATNDRLTQTEKDLTSAKEELQKAIDAEKTARENGDTELANKLAEEVEAREAAVKALETAIENLNAKVDAELNLLKHTDAAFAQQLAAVQTGLTSLSNLVDAHYNELKAEMVSMEARLQSQIDQNKQDIAKNAFNINKLTNDLTDLNGRMNAMQASMQNTTIMLANHMAEFARYQAIVEGRLAYLESTAAQLAEAIDDLKNNVLPNIENQILENNLLIEKNVTDIAANAQALEDYKKAAAETFALLQQALKDMSAAINTLDTKVGENATNIETLRKAFEAYQADIEKELNEKFSALTSQIQDMKKKYDDDTEALRDELDAIRGSIATNKTLIDAEIQNREAADKDLKNGLEALKMAYTNKVIELEKSISDLDKRLTAIEKAFEEYKEQVKQMIANAIETAVTNANAYTDTKVGELKVDLEGQIDALDQKLTKEIDDAKKAAEDALNNAVSNLQSLINGLDGRVEDLEEQMAALIQNITFVPEYADGKATAVRVLGPQSTTLSATTLTAVFEVTPASAAEALKTNGFVVVEPVKTRGEALKGERLAVEVIDAAAGRVKVTAFVHNMPADYGSYAFTLNVEAENKVVASSDYVYIHENADAQYKFVYVTEADNKTIEEHPNWDTTLGRLVFNTKWTKAAEAAINFTEGYVYKLADNNGFYNIDEIEAKHGLAADAMTVLSKVTSTGDVDAFTIKDDTLVDMVSESEYDMYAHIGKMITLKVEALNDWGWDFSFEADFNITGVKIENNTYYIEEAGDLYWLSNNPHYRTNANNTTVEFLADVEIDMAGYGTDGVAAGLAPYAPVSNLMGTVTTINGNGATVKNLAVEGVESVGMFGYVKGDINSLTVTNAVVKGNHWVGAIAGKICGAIKDCHVADSNITATPNVQRGFIMPTSKAANSAITATSNNNGAWDNGDKVGGIVGYSEPDAVPGASHAIENCSVVNTNITGFSHLAGIVGATYYGDNLKNNKVENVNVLAIQREFLNPGYNAGEYGAETFIGRVLGCDLNNTYAWTVAGDGANTVSGEDLRIRYAVGAEVDATPVDVAEHTLELSTANGLAWFSNHVVDKVYYTFQNVVFVEDIDLEGKLSFTDDDVTFKPINNWEATTYRSLNFDGQNKTVKNFVMKNTNEKDLGLFGSYVGSIKNVKMENVTLLGLGRVAPIAAQLWGNVDNCHVTNLVAYADVKAGDDGDKVGGIVGQMQDPNTITNCSVSKADIMGYRNLGGIAGHANIASWDDSNKLSEVTIWINQVAVPYGSYVPFDTESAYVGRQDGVAVAFEAEGVEVYNILNASLDRRYVETRGKQLRLGYDLNASPVAAVLKDNALSSVYSKTENGLALDQFAVDYASYQDVFQVTEMALTSNWTAIGSDFASAFMGVYDGNNKTIEGLQIVNPLETPSGFFGFVRGNIKNVNMVNPIIYGSHWAAAVAAVMYGTVEGCTVDGGEVILMPNHDGTRFDNGDKAAAIVGYLAANGVGDDKVLNNKVSNIKIKGYRDVAVLVGCANNIDEMSGNTITNCAVIVDQITGKYPVDDPRDENIGLLIGRLDNDTVANVKNNTIDAESSLNRVSGVNNEIVKILDTKEIGNK